MIAPLSHRRFAGVSLDLRVHSAPASQAMRIAMLRLQYLRHRAFGMSDLDAAGSICQAPILAISGSRGEQGTGYLLARMVRVTGVNVWSPYGANRECDRNLVRASCIAQPGDAVIAGVALPQLARAKTFRPRVAVITNIVPASTGRFRSVGECAATAELLVHQLRDGDVAVLNAINVWTRKIGYRLMDRGIRVAWFDRGPSQCDNTVTILSGRIIVRRDDVEHDLGAVAPLACQDIAEVENALAASAAAIAFGVPHETVARVLAAYQELRDRPTGVIR